METGRLESAIIAWLIQNHGIEGRLERLGGENLNYRVVTPGGERYVCKAMERSTAEETADLEFSMLEHVRDTGFELGLPFILRDRDGRIESPIRLPLPGRHRARLLSFVDGELLEHRDVRNSALFADVGRSLAVLDSALAGFDHPAAYRGHPWELARAGMHCDKAELIRDRGLRALVTWAFELWDVAADELPELPCQVIHGDANPENIILDGERVAGFVDFGDACFNPRICEVAVCLAYLMMGQEAPLAAAASMLGGYSAEIELSGEELAVLLPLVCGRLAVTVCMATSRLSVDPGHPNWFVSLEPAIELLGRLHEVGYSALTPG
ncbi:MAG: phosphotransferase [Lysobacterales bacterium]|jgi:hypothetical protein